MKDGDSRQQTEIAVFSLLESGLAQLGLEAETARVQSLTDLTLILETWSSRINLTGHRGPLEIAARLVLDAAAMASVIPELQGAESVADLGSGAGFPGLPLAILHPQLHVYLVDSRLKRHHFRREARRQLGLERVVSILGRSDEVEAIASDIVVAQAMTTPREALALMGQGALNPAVMVTHVGGINSAAETIKDLPSIPGGKKLIYTQKQMPMTALDDFAALGEKDPFFAALGDITARHNGLWSVEAETYVLKHADGIER